VLLEGHAGQVLRLVLQAGVDLQELLVRVGLGRCLEDVVEGEADPHDEIGLERTAASTFWLMLVGSVLS
jgi:hypothetical protein